MRRRDFLAGDCAGAAGMICRRDFLRPRLVVDRGYTSRYDLALQNLKDLPYGYRREHEAEDTVRWRKTEVHARGDRSPAGGRGIYE